MVTRRVSDDYPLYWRGRWNRLQCERCYFAGLRLWQTRKVCSECARRMALGRPALGLSPLPGRG